MFPADIICNHLSNIKWLQNYLLPCPFKKITGIDCPGCGFQRSLLALLQGNLGQSLHLYPATIPLLIAGTVTLFDARFSIDRKNYLKKSVYIFAATIIAGSYLIKMSGYFN